MAFVPVGLNEGGVASTVSLVEASLGPYVPGKVVWPLSLSLFVNGYKIVSINFSKMK